MLCVFHPLMSLLQPYGCISFQYVPSSVCCSGCLGWRVLCPLLGAVFSKVGAWGLHPPCTSPHSPLVRVKPARRLREQ